MHRMRIRGAIHHPFLEKFRNGRLIRWDLNWNNDNRHFLNRYFGRKARYPKMVVHTSHPPETADNSLGQSDNWFHAYFRKSFPMADGADNRTIVNELYNLLWRMLTDQGLLHEMRAGAVYNYALDPSAIFVQNKVATYTCNSCNSRLYTTHDNPYAVGTPCLDYRCAGQYE
jgi:DEAD/DEAH box helicase domain-containing protein